MHNYILNSGVYTYLELVTPAHHTDDASPDDTLSYTDTPPTNNHPHYRYCYQLQQSRNQ